MSESYIIAQSLITGTWYRVTRWEEHGDGKIRALEQEEIDEADVPEAVLEALGGGKDESDASEYRIDEVLE